MPPKKDQKGKGPQPKPQKVAVDKTFGLKNKGGKKTQNMIKQIESQKSTPQSALDRKKAAEKEQRDREKMEAEKARKEAAELFKPVQVQKVPFGVDPKTVLCQFYKKGGCEKGKKCKFSHDLAVERKGEKKNLYTDTREEEQEEKKKDTMDDWDEEKLRKVVMSKHGNPKTTTDKVCKYFIEAVENQKYGWFWQCPNGGDKCMYKHSLPPGFVLKTKEQRAAEKALMDKSPLNTFTIEEFLESERYKLTGTLTPVTPESFAKWKKDRLDKKAAEAEAHKAKDATGRAMFEQGGWEGSESEESSDEDEDETDGWNLEALRKETEALRAQRERERLGLPAESEIPTEGDAGEDAQEESSSQ
ncbi:hypothetical protein L228DRAFT_251110 [Xylona heveae TC161]|uniref:C3H1-type domain-containing protein n=1 Tax=Xylona heveae (strain CBS 132557 / TC161) TaxID=1328760 RepID=A0A164ZTR3_XYLHT|nr:hypothetical protein L228DRAFT_251110 [Xylona heveae TC161]KZF19502.1 hypothetical protein L228DRAFT_251110 [Xylona heveae TC161]